MILFTGIHEAAWYLSSLYCECAFVCINRCFISAGEKPPKVTEVIAQTVVEPLPRVSSVATTTIPVAPPASLINPDKPVAMASAPAHVSTASALTKQKLLQNIQMKEQQKLIEQALTQQLGSSSQELLAQALKNIIPQVCMNNS